MGEIRLNLNDNVRFKLTDVGREIYYHRFDEVNAKFTRARLTPTYPKVDENGYSTMQLWDFMQLYGPHIGMGMPNVIEPLTLVFDADTSEKGRLLRLDEIHRKTVAWIEFRNRPKWLALVDDDATNVKRITLAIGGSSAGYAKCFITEDDISIGLNDCDYNVTWRAWTGEPPKAFRDSEEWNKGD